MTDCGVCMCKVEAVKMQRGHIYLDIHIDRQICIYPYACDAENTNAEHAHTPEKRDTGEYRYAHMRMNLDIHMNMANAEHAHSPEKRGTGECATQEQSCPSQAPQACALALPYINIHQICECLCVCLCLCVFVCVCVCVFCVCVCMDIPEFCLGEAAASIAYRPPAQGC